MAARAGKREQSLLLAISTPPKTGQDDSVMRRLVDHGREHVDPSFFFREFAAPAGCADDDEQAWKMANPALDDFCTATRRATLPPKMRENAFSGIAGPVGQGRRLAPDGAWAPCTDRPGSSLTADVVLGPRWLVQQGLHRARRGHHRPAPPRRAGPASGRPPRAAATGACPWSRSRTPSGRRARGGGCSRWPRPYRWQRSLEALDGRHRGP